MVYLMQVAGKIGLFPILNKLQDELVCAAMHKMRCSSVKKLQNPIPLKVIL